MGRQLGGDTMTPSGLYARLCRAFLVVNNIPLDMAVCFMVEYTVSLICVLNLNGSKSGWQLMFNPFSADNETYSTRVLECISPPMLICCVSSVFSAIGTTTLWDPWDASPLTLNNPRTKYIWSPPTSVPNSQILHYSYNSAGRRGVRYTQQQLQHSGAGRAMWVLSWHLNEDIATVLAVGKPTVVASRWWSQHLEATTSGPPTARTVAISSFRCQLKTHMALPAPECCSCSCVYRTPRRPALLWL